MGLLILFSVILVIIFFITMLVLIVAANIFLKFLRWVVLEYFGCTPIVRNRNFYQRTNLEPISSDRQGNIFTISDDSVNNNGSRFPDLFYLEPSHDETSRIRAQLEKDNRELPTYDEVMALSRLEAQATPATTATQPTEPLPSIVRPLTLSVPPYSEVDPNPIMDINSTVTIEPTQLNANATTIVTAQTETVPIAGHSGTLTTSTAPSTSQAAANVAATANTANDVTLTITGSSTNV